MAPTVLQHLHCIDQTSYQLWLKVLSKGRKVLLNTVPIYILVSLCRIYTVHVGMFGKGTEKDLLEQTR